MYLHDTSQFMHTVSEVNGRDLQMWEKYVNLKSTKAYVSCLNTFGLPGVLASNKMTDWIERNVQASTFEISQKFYFQLLLSKFWNFRKDYSLNLGL